MRNFLPVACAIATFLPPVLNASLPLEQEDGLITKITYKPSQWSQDLAQQINPDVAQLILRHVKGEAILGVEADEFIEGAVLVEEEEFPEYPGQQTPNGKADVLLENAYQHLGFEVDIPNLSRSQLQSIANFAVRQDKTTARMIYDMMKSDLSQKKAYLARGEMHRIKLDEIEPSKNLIACFEEAFSELD